MTKEIKDAIIGKTIAATVTAFVGLIAFWFGSFATNANVQALEYRVETIEDKSSTYAKRTDLQLVLSGLCIIDKRTCQLNKGVK